MELEHISLDSPSKSVVNSFSQVLLLVCGILTPPSALPLQLSLPQAGLGLWGHRTGGCLGASTTRGAEEGLGSLLSGSEGLLP